MTKQVANTKMPVSRYTRRIHAGNLLFLSPTIILFGIVVLLPFLQGLPYSFTSWKSIVSDNHPYNGLTNYAYLLSNKYFLRSLGVTFKYALLYLVSANLTGFFFAMMIWKSQSI